MPKLVCIILEAGSKVGPEPGTWADVCRPLPVVGAGLWVPAGGVKIGPLQQRCSIAWARVLHRGRDRRQRARKMPQKVMMMT